MIPHTNEPPLPSLPFLPNPSKAPGVPPTRSFVATLCGVPTQFVLTAYSNRIFVVVTQSQNFGTLIQASADNPLNMSGTSYSTRVLVGRRDDEVLEAYARTMVELITKRAPNAGPLLLSISIEQHSSEMFHAVMQAVEEHRVW